MSWAHCFLEGGLFLTAIAASVAFAFGLARLANWIDENYGYGKGLAFIFLVIGSLSFVAVVIACRIGALK